MRRSIVRNAVLALGVLFAQAAQARPDLIFVGVPQLSSIAAAGRPLQISNVRVMNNAGFFNIAGPSRIGHYLQDTASPASFFLGSVPVPPLSWGESTTLSSYSMFVPASIPPGAYLFEIRLDYLDQVSESDESNNHFIRPIDIVYGVDFAFATQPTWSASVVSLGSTVTVTSFDVQNLTPLPYGGSVRVGHYISLDPSDLSGATRLGGSTFTVSTFPFTVPGETLTLPAAGQLAAGSYYFVTMLDDLQAIDEDSETNNLSVGAGVTAVQVAWTRIAEALINDAMGSRGVAWGDYDNDGDHDLFISSGGTTSGQFDRLLRNDGADTWTVSPADFYTIESGQGVVWADLDGDQWLDLYVSRSSAGGDGPNTYYHNDRGLEFRDYTNAWPGLGDIGEGAGVSVVDFDNDGDLDVHLSNMQCYLCVHSDDQLFENRHFVFSPTSDPDLQYSECTTGSAWADYDGDGDQDVFVTGSWRPQGPGMGCFGRNRLLRNDGNGSFTPVFEAFFESDTINYGCAWGDYDNDGDMDLFVAGSDRLYRNEAGSAFVDATPAWGPIGGRGPCWLDYDLDGDLDLFVSSAGGGISDHLFRNEGGGTFVDATVSPMLNLTMSLGAAAADYDDDGDLDLYVATNLASDRFYRNDQQTGYHWLQVDLRGTVSNYFGVGARVEISAGGVTQIREVEAGSGYLSQSSLTVEFGVGSQTQIDRLVIRWPSGIVQDFTQGIGLDRRLLIWESDSGATDNPPDDVGRDLALHGPQPNPFNPRTVFRFELPHDGEVSVVVTDAKGRKVRTLLSRKQIAAGSHTITWDGRDDRGQDVASGMYLCRLESPEGTRTQKAALVR